MCKVCARAGPSTMHDMGARLLAERLQLLICFGMAKRCRHLIPVARLALVLAHALAELIHYADVEHGPRLAQPCGLLVPAPGFGVILRNTFPVVIHHAKPVHCTAFAKRSGLLVPSPCRRVILWHALAVVIHPAEIAHGVGVTLLCGPLIPAASLAIILCNSSTGFIQPAHVGQGEDTSKRRSILEVVSCSLEFSQRLVGNSAVIACIRKKATQLDR